LRFSRKSYFRENEDSQKTEPAGEQLKSFSSSTGKS